MGDTGQGKGGKTSGTGAAVEGRAQSPAPPSARPASLAVFESLASELHNSGDRKAAAMIAYPANPTWKQRAGSMPGARFTMEGVTPTQAVAKIRGALESRGFEILAENKWANESGRNVLARHPAGGKTVRAYIQPHTLKGVRTIDVQLRENPANQRA
jgi:hypothetical protein